MDNNGSSHEVDDNELSELESQSLQADGRGKKRRRINRPYPVYPFENALQLAYDIQQLSSGKPIRRITLLDALGKSPDSSSSRDWITNASKYGLTKGSYSSENIELTPEGYTASADDVSEVDKARARVRLAVLNIPIYDSLYEEFVGNKLPSRQVLIDTAQKYSVPNELVDEVVETFLVNMKFVGLLKILSGAERLITVEHLLEEIAERHGQKFSAPHISMPTMPAVYEDTSRQRALNQPSKSQFDNICFYITPIGDEQSEERSHADLFLGSLVEPALESFGLEVVRADHIQTPGTITRQILEYLLHAKLVIADLSYHNPNVFYELAIRHATRLPTVQIIRANDRIPFDLHQIRTIRIDTANIYTLVPRLDTYRAQITSQVRLALEEPDSTDNPIAAFYPTFRLQFE